MLLRLKQQSNLAFSFLLDEDPVHPYYVFLKSWGESALAAEYARQQRLQAERAEARQREEEQRREQEQRAATAAAKGPFGVVCCRSSRRSLLFLSGLQCFSFPALRYGVFSCEAFVLGTHTSPLNCGRQQVASSGFFGGAAVRTSILYTTVISSSAKRTRSREEARDSVVFCGSRIRRVASLCIASRRGPSPLLFLSACPLLPRRASCLRVPESLLSVRVEQPRRLEFGCAEGRSRPRPRPCRAPRLASSDMR